MSTKAAKKRKTQELIEKSSAALAKAASLPSAKPLTWSEFVHSSEFTPSQKQRALWNIQQAMFCNVLKQKERLNRTDPVFDRFVIHPNVLETRQKKRLKIQERYNGRLATSDTTTSFNFKLSEFVPKELFLPPSDDVLVNEATMTESELSVRAIKQIADDPLLQLVWNNATHIGESFMTRERAKRMTQEEKSTKRTESLKYSSLGLYIAAVLMQQCDVSQSPFTGIHSRKERTVFIGFYMVLIQPPNEPRQTVDKELLRPQHTSAILTTTWSHLDHLVDDRHSLVKLYVPRPLNEHQILQQPLQTEPLVYDKNRFQYGAILKQNGENSIRKMSHTPLKISGAYEDVGRFYEQFCQLISTRPHLARLSRTEIWSQVFACVMPLPRSNLFNIFRETLHDQTPSHEWLITHAGTHVLPAVPLAVPV